MTQRLLTLGLALAFALAQVQAAAAQSKLAPAFAGPAAAAPPAEWSAVQSLSPGQKIVVRTKDGDRLTGRFDSANDLLISFTDGRRKVSLTRESIKVVQLDRGNSRGKGALFGALIGVGAGAAVGGWVYSQGDFVGSVVPVGALMGAGIGAGIGAATGKGNKNETVYEAP